ncbi:MAG: heavy metal translocating P-type ATPase metal-binding domain-containing protein, partial [Saprospiraceae bacterium]|nr:heavy metal translocating P-type ATPase metal-binding domain-containing protein [Saprospiraceae bacterium]
MSTQTEILCSHCGETCPDQSIQLNELNFCCTGCKSVYSILNQHQLSTYYCLNEMPGHSMNETSTNKFHYLDDQSIVAKLISFKNSQQTQVEFFVPQIHCSSCLWLLEHLYKLDAGILSSEVNFNEKKVRLSFDHQIVSLKQVVELLSSVGYEPLITLQDYDDKEVKPDRRKDFIKLGLVGFCFANIMMISFPEYLGMSVKSDPLLSIFFRYANLVLAIPVFFYGASDFFATAWQGIKQRFLNIDVPISLAIIITFVRSIYEVINQSGSGYFDSMSGIVFFMLIGRGLQQKTFNNLKFNRDFKSYFPISVTLIQDKVEVSTKIQDVKEGDVLKVMRNEIIPVDCILSSKSAEIDYSFVTGENDIQPASAGELIYSGGKVHSPQLEVICVKPFSQGHFTSLWNNQVFNDAEKKQASFVEIISKYFSFALLMIAASAFIYWHIVNPVNAWNALTAVLIVACPCTLLLASSYTYGFMIELFAKEGMFVKSSKAIDSLNEVNHI